MSLFDNIKRFLRIKKVEKQEELLLPNDILEEKIENQPSSSLLEIQTNTLPAITESVPYWLENEDSLRDEGVIFGLSDSKAEDKILIIRNYFANQTAGIEKEIEQFSEKIGEINLVIGQKETRIDELKNKASLLEEKQVDTSHHLPRTFIGLLLSIGMATGNYFLIFSAMKPNFIENAWIISLGVFLAGMFNLYNPKSFLHEKDSFNWRQILEEVGMPFAASLFVFVQVYAGDDSHNQSIIKSVALFIFVFFLFLFSGKLLLGNLTVFKQDFTVFWSNILLRKDKKTKSKDWDTEVQQLTVEMDEQRIKKWQILPDLNKAEANLTSLNAQRDMMIKLFESEFNLARSYKDKLTGKQINEILK